MSQQEKNNLRFVSSHEVDRSVLGSELSWLRVMLGPWGGGIWSLSENPGATSQQISKWESCNHVSLDTDLARLLSAANGLVVRWAIPLGGKVRDVGLLSVNAVEKIVPFQPTQPTWQNENLHQNHRFFLLSSVGGIGTTCLAYPSLSSDSSKRETIAQVWFCGLDGTWHQLASCFKDYLRLALLHLGVRGWEYAFSPCGLDPEARQWLRLLNPNQLMLQWQHSPKKNTEAKM